MPKPQKKDLQNTIAGQLASAAEQMGIAAKNSMQNKHPKSAHENNSQFDVSKTTDAFVNQSEHAKHDDKKGCQNKQPENSAFNMLKPRAAARTKKQQKLLKFLHHHGEVITTYQLLADANNISFGTVRAIIAKFEEEGLLTKTKHCENGRQCIKIVMEKPQ